jgi:hypothetical protein
MFMAGPILRRADKDKDGKVTLDELIAAAEALFKEADRNKNGTLDEKELTDGINLLFAPPRGFGQPGSGPPRPREGGAPAEPKKEANKP